MSSRFIVKAEEHCIFSIISVKWSHLYLSFNTCICPSIYPINEPLVHPSIQLANHLLSHPFIHKPTLTHTFLPSHTLHSMRPIHSPNTTHWSSQAFTQHYALTHVFTRNRILANIFIQNHTPTYAFIPPHPNPRIHPKTHTGTRIHPKTHTGTRIHPKTHTGTRIHPKTHTGTRIQAATLTKVFLQSHCHAFIHATIDPCCHPPIQTNAHPIQSSTHPFSQPPAYITTTSMAPPPRWVWW